MVAILDFTGEATLSISETACPATGSIMGISIVKITPIDTSQHMAISAVLDILVAILDYGDSIAKPTSGMGLQPLITHTKWY